MNFAIGWSCGLLFLAYIGCLHFVFHAAACLVKIAGVDLATETSLASFFTTVTDMDKQLFYGEKFLSSAGSAALQSVATLVTCLLISHVDKVGAVTPACLLRALATCLLSHHSGVRRHALREVGKVGSSLGGASTVCALLSQVSEQLQTREVVLETQSRTEVQSRNLEHYTALYSIAICHLMSPPGPTGQRRSSLRRDTGHRFLVKSFMSKSKRSPVLD